MRITIERTAKYFPVEIPDNVKPEEWIDKQNAWVKNSHPFAFEINKIIKEKMDLVDDVVKRFYTAKKDLTFPLVFKELQKSNNTNLFNEYFSDCLKDPPETLDNETLKRYRACLKHLNAFNAAITFNNLSDELFQRFKKYCERKELVGSTINGYFNALKKVVYWARKDSHITKEHQQSIFEDVHIKIGKPKKDHLEIEEIQTWKNHVFDKKKKSFERDRDMFLLQIYTGFYYNDLKELLKSELRKDHEYGNYINAARYKNDNLAIIPLWKFPNALPLVKKYGDHNPKSKYLLSREFFMEDQVYNRRLKEIAKQLGWTRNVYNKLARNTNSQLYIRFGADRPIVSKIMGHEREETTNSYYEVNIRDVIEGTRNLDFDPLK
ncbi:MAG TPA: phage integrase SAM-like domain-containing protein, partial [Puia sp.]|nr:phage integrase SAM-like domain-containing protein [Puia sp.]